MFVSKECFRSIKGETFWHTEIWGNCPVRVKTSMTKASSILKCLNSLTTLPEGVLYTNKWT